MIRGYGKAHWFGVSDLGPLRFSGFDDASDRRIGFEFVEQYLLFVS